MKWFRGMECIEDLKQAYFKLAKKYHSDVGGNDEIMKEINSEYSELHSRLKDVHRSMFKDGKNSEEFYTSKTETAECPEDFINIVRELLKMGLDVELCGRWLWITGGTKKWAEQLKKLGCRWSPKKVAWSWHYPGTARKCSRAKSRGLWEKFGVHTARSISR